eukprot:2655755-Amphidinium_carterae.1
MDVSDDCKTSQSPVAPLSLPTKVTLFNPPGMRKPWPAIVTRVPPRAEPRIGLIEWTCNKPPQTTTATWDFMGPSKATSGPKSTHPFQSSRTFKLSRACGVVGTVHSIPVEEMDVMGHAMLPM